MIIAAAEGTKKSPRAICRVHGHFKKVIHKSDLSMNSFPRNSVLANWLRAANIGKGDEIHVLFIFADYFPHWEGYLRKCRYTYWKYRLSLILFQSCGQGLAWRSTWVSCTWNMFTWCYFVFWDDQCHLLIWNTDF